jgi:L-histidine Nalpha-methyltransferase
MTIVEAGHRVDFSELLEGLRKDQKEIPCKYFYDERGSVLFEQICELDEYYPTRTEIGIIKDNIDSISGVFDHRSVMMEYGSGSSSKTRLLLDKLDKLAAYVPIDISADHLATTAKELRGEYPALQIIPVAADYTKPFKLPLFDFSYSRKVVYFPGSTIGNFEPDLARDFLRRIKEVVGKGGGLLIGVDLRKDESILEPAYNDAQGITSEFNKNVLVRLNNEYYGNFDLSTFTHKAIFNAEHSRIEMYLISTKDQHVLLDDAEISFSKGERILTEYSYKHTPASLEWLVEDIFSIEQVWLDDRKFFSVQYWQVL